MDETELRWWFDHAKKDILHENEEGWLVSAMLRHVTPEDKELGYHDGTIYSKLITGTTEDRFITGVLEVTSVAAIKARNLRSDSLVIYDCLNPIDEIWAQFDYAKDVENSKDEKLLGVNAGIDKHIISVAANMESARVKNTRRVYVQYDFDLQPEDNAEQVYKRLHEAALYLFGQGAFFIVRTAHGYHVIVKKEHLNFNPYNYIKECDLNSREFIYCGSDKHYCPLPGTEQFGHDVVVVNKEDFD